MSFWHIIYYISKLTLLHRKDSKNWEEFDIEVCIASLCIKSELLGKYSNQWCGDRETEGAGVVNLKRSFRKESFWHWEKLRNPCEIRDFPQCSALAAMRFTSSFEIVFETLREPSLQNNVLLLTI